MATSGDVVMTYLSGQYGTRSRRKIGICARKITKRSVMAGGGMAKWQRSSLVRSRMARRVAWRVACLICTPVTTTSALPTHRVHSLPGGMAGGVEKAENDNRIVIDGSSAKLNGGEPNSVRVDVKTLALGWQKAGRASRQHQQPGRTEKPAAASPSGGRRSANIASRA